MYYVVKYKNANAPDAVAVVRRKPSKSSAYLYTATMHKPSACRVAKRVHRFSTPIPGCGRRR
jgi:hypothetical protein